MKTRQSRERRAIALGVDMWTWLVLDWGAMPDGEAKRQQGLELLPFVRPKLKAVDMTVSGTVDHTIHIGLIGDV